MKTKLPTSEQFKRAAAITEKIETLQAELAAILSGVGFKGSRKGLSDKADKPKRQMSEDARNRIAAAQRKRWAKVKKAKKAEESAAG